MEDKILEKFKLYNPYLSNIGIVSYTYLGDYEYLFEIQNGTFYIFDDFWNITFRVNSDRKNLTNDEIAREFGHGLERKMRNLRITQEELAFDIGVSQTTVSRYINGKSFPTYEIIREICKMFNCSMDDFSYDRAFRQKGVKYV